MQNTQTKDLFFKDGSSDKVYHVQIMQDNNDYYVNFQYGKRGSTLKAGTKTEKPVSQEEAVKIFNQIVKEKMSKGYQDMGGADPSSIVSTAIVSQDDTGIYPQLLCPIDDSNLKQYLDDDNFVGQEKFDGQRRMFKFSQGRLTSINKKGLSVPNLAEMEKILTKSKKDFVCDGEIIGSNYYLFDLISYDGESVSDQPYKERLKIIAKDKLLSQFLVPTAQSQQEKQAMLNKVRSNRGEGMVFKRVDSKYVPGRPASGGSQVKYKFWESATLEVQSRHKSKRSVEVGAYDKEGKLHLLGNVTIPANYDVPNTGDIVEVVYLYAFEGGSIYQSKYKGVRDDQNKFDCLLSQLKYKASYAEDDDEEKPLEELVAQKLKKQKI